MWYNITTRAKGIMPNMDDVGSLAVDFVGKKIYWSNPKQQLVTIIYIVKYLKGQKNSKNNNLTMT